MSAPKGNQYALENKGGRPRKYDLNREAQDLLVWSEQEDAMSLYEFTSAKPYLAQDLSRFAGQSEEFSLALKKAKERISQRREKACNQGVLNYGIWARSVLLYDKLLWEHVQELRNLDTKRKGKKPSSS